MMYAIRNVKDHGLAWSNEWGWVDNESYDLFTQQEHDTLHLPLDGEWWTVGDTKQADHVDGYDRDDLGESPDY
jgi:hypothetical protein